MTISHRRTRSAGLVLSTAVLGVALLGAAPAAQATDITNPAEHPDPITLTIDGQTYRDGADTLPGYDDYACTPIPNVEYDFADDQIQYYDGQGELIKTAHWTEWSRISSYETWVAQQQAGKPSSTQTTTSANATTPAATSTTTTSTATTTPAAAAPAATSPATTSPASKTTSTATRTTTAAPKTKRAAPKNTSSATGTKGSVTQTERSTRTSRSSRATTPRARQGSASSHAKKRGTSTAPSAKRSTPANRSTAASGASADGAETAPSAASGASSSGVATTSQGAGAPSSTPSSAGTPKFKLVSATGAGGGVGDTRPIGVGILVAVFGVACLAFLFGSARRRSFGRVS